MQHFSPNKEMDHRDFGFG